jgi:hypothetical protein
MSNVVNINTQSRQLSHHAAQISRVLAAYEDRRKAIVFLPSSGHGYVQPPYEEITEEQYRTMMARMAPLAGELSHSDQQESQFCEGGICEAG